MRGHLFGIGVPVSSLPPVLRKTLVKRDEREGGIIRNFVRQLDGAALPGGKTKD